MMKARLVAVLFTVLAFAFFARADSPEDQYVRIYNLIQQADAMNENHQFSAAVARYAEAQTALTRFQSIHPDWNVQVVRFRMDYLAGKIAEITGKTSPPTAVVPRVPTSPTTATPTATTPPVVAGPAIITVAPPPPMPINPQQEEKIRSLEEQIRQLSGDKASLESNRALLEAKLKEALSAQPAMIDPREFAKVKDQNLSLLKENDLLKVKVEQSKSKTVVSDPAAVEQVRRELADAKRSMAGLAAANAVLLAENATLRGKSVIPSLSGGDSDALRQENEILKKQVTELKKAPASGKNAELQKQLQTAQSQLAAMESDRDMLRLEKTALENRLKQPGVAGAAVAIDAAAAAKIKQLEGQRDDLQKKLDVALADLAGRKSVEKPAQVEELNGQLAVLRTRIEVLESKPMPYTAEELAMLSKPEAPTMLVASFRSPPRKSPGDLPGNGASLLAEAKRYYSAGELDKAEVRYQDLIKLDSTNIGALTDLASIQVELRHTEDAEKNIQAALAVDPNHEYSLFVLGRVKFSEGKYDDALDAFSRAAAANPQNAETQNYIGITLSEKGLRVPAEAALRKAVQLDPKYGNAHANLAFIYITAKPPMVALAKWHYEKAIAAGQPKNPDLEKRLKEAAAPDGSH